MIASSISDPRRRACMVCGDAFDQRQPLQRVCGLSCARRVPILARQQARAEKKRIRERIEEMRPLSYWTKQAQTAFNAWCRARDANQPCISCGTLTAPQWDAGHYLTVGARPELRFEPLNVHKQCSRCNDFLSGNLIRFRIELIRRIGVVNVAWLEGPHEPKRYRAEELKAIRDDYRARLKALEKGAP
jgi:hypothetical protein